MAYGTGGLWDAIGSPMEQEAVGREAMGAMRQGSIRCVWGDGTGGQYDTVEGGDGIGDSAFGT